MADDLNICSAAMAESLDKQFRGHLAREDGQEDLCFALYNPSYGERRFTALLAEAIMPEQGERQVHGNTSFNSSYFERAIAIAMERDCGLALLHSHPGASGWQGMSQDDFDAESGAAGAVRVSTGLPFLGLTLSTASGFWSARMWERREPKVWTPVECENVRVVGSRLQPWGNPSCNVAKEFPDALRRTVHAWGGRLQRSLADLRVGLVGLGSVGSLVGEELARMGFGEVVGIDFDIIKDHNRDRTLHAYSENVAAGELKVNLAARSAIRSSTMPGFTFRSLATGIHRMDGYRAALDCDVIFSCVDRPWARSILNHIAYAHLIPVIDGGIAISRKPNGELRSADWGVFVSAPSRQCLECAGQYESGMVAMDQNGDLDDPTYVESLPDDSPLKSNENVFMFSTALASLEAMKLVQLVGAPGGVCAPAEERHSFPSGTVEVVDARQCHESCACSSREGMGEKAGNPGIEDW